MAFKRIGTLVAVLASSACSHVPLSPTAYSALPPPTAMAATTAPTAPLVDLAAPQPEADDGPMPVVIPGTLKLQNAELGQRGVNPLAVLDFSRRSRLAWKTLRPQDLIKPPVYASVSRMYDDVDIRETATTSGKGSAPESGLKAGKAPLEYDREATMETLLKGGRMATSSICSGC